jgi:chemotaxis protein MotB
MLKKLLVITIGFALIGLTGCQQGQEVNEDVKVLNAKLDQCRQDKRILESDLQSANDEIASLTARLQDARDDAQKYSELAARLEEAKQKLQQEKQAISDVVEDLEWLVNLEQRGNDTVMVMDNAILFPSGSHELTEQAKTGLDTLAQRLGDVPNATIRVDGHTDGEPIRATRDKYSSNWDLAAERAESVRAYLAENGVMSSRMYITGFGPIAPRVEPTNPTDPMEENRRVEILLLFDREGDVQDLLEDLDM